jgi:hypothetical protein
MPRNDLIQLRSDTAAKWADVNPTLAIGEVGFETDTGKFKIGTGSTAWNSLPYAPTIPSITVTSEMIVDGTILDIDINASAAIAPSKVAGVFTTGDSSNNTITISTSAPTGGSSGDIWFKY